jgi:membrane protease YdiL (CAAX protease family)
MSDPADLARRLFINEEGELRSGWRVLVFFILYAVAASLLGGALRVAVAIFPSLGFLLYPPSPPDEYLTYRELMRLGLGQLMNIAAALAATAVCAPLLEHRGLASVGYKPHRGWLRDFLLGSIIGALSLALAVAIAAAAGALRFEVNTPAGAHLARGFVILFLLFIVSAAFEELLFRGFAFQAITHNLGAVAAVLITSTLFGLAHLSNANASAFSTINTILAGVWLGVAYLMTRSLWFATALHYSWNLAMAFVFGLPVSGISMFNQLAWLRPQDRPPEWVSGGSYGPEGGAAATLVLLLSTLVIWKSGLLKPAEEMLASIRHGHPEPRLADHAPDKEADA